MPLRVITAAGDLASLARRPMVYAPSGDHGRKGQDRLSEEKKLTIVEIFHKCQLPRGPLGNTKSGISSEIHICLTNQAQMSTFQQTSDRLSEEKEITIVEIFHKCQLPRAPGQH
jgi:hypothetical protein